ncbi:hypothetical protein [Endozoicomonas sp. ISHI1]|uniref:hypothetical protein n=1 Tax=Endozoicomonas sp. ISHI1 TaxID=2825882 RepID=UPI0021494D95|nr:hypothetical protein [Endozoicomonas sp. ISHI1]
MATISGRKIVRASRRTSTSTILQQFEYNFPIIVIAIANFQFQFLVYKLYFIQQEDYPMNASSQIEKKQDSFNVPAQQSNKQSDCNFNNDYYGDRVCRVPSNPKEMAKCRVDHQ